MPSDSRVNQSDNTSLAHQESKIPLADDVLRATSPFESISSQIKEMEKDTCRYQEILKRPSDHICPAAPTETIFPMDQFEVKSSLVGKGPGSRALSDLVRVLQRIVYKITA